MICSNPHDYQLKQYNKLYTLSFVPKEFRVKADYYTKEIANQYYYPYILKPYICDSFSIGVTKINNEKQRDEYFKIFHPEFTMIESYTNFSYEVGITYIFDNNINNKK